MKSLRRIRYWTMSPWNRSSAPAYNLKIYNVVNDNLQDKVYELMETDEFWDEINYLVAEFDRSNSFRWQAGFNGRSGGYLVLYKGGKRVDGTVFSYPGRNIDEKEVPSEVLRKFRKLAIDIVKLTEEMARKCEVSEVEYNVPQTKKVVI